RQTASSEDIDKLKSDMENEIHSISLDIMEKIGALETKMDEIKTGTRDTEKDAKILRLERRIEDLSSLNNKFIDLNSDVSNLKSAIGNAALAPEGMNIAKAHMARLEKLENDIKDVQNTPRTVPTFDSVKLKQMAERIIGMTNELRFLKNEMDEVRMNLDDVSKFDNRFKTVYDDISKVRKQIEEMPKTVSHTDREILEEVEGIKRQLESVPRLDNKFKTVYEEINKLRNRLEEMPKTLNTTNKEILYEIDELKTRVDDTSKLDTKFKSIYDEISKIKNHMEEMPKELDNTNREIIDEIDRIKKQMDEIPSTTGSKISRIYGELGEIKKYMEESPGIAGSRIKYIDNELNDIKKQLSSLPTDKTGKIRQVYDEINKLKKRVEEMPDVNNEMKYVRNEINSIKKRLAESLTTDKIKNIYEEIGKVRQTADEELAYKMSMDKKIADIENRIGAQKTTGNELPKNTDAISVHEELLDEINEVRRMVEEESAQRISSDKKLLNIENRIGATPDKRVDIDYRKLSEMLKSDKAIEEAIEKKFEESSLKLVTERINDFARLMDKRTPNLVTKDELAKLEEKISATRMRVPVRNDRDVSERIAKLESSIKSMIDALNAMKYSKSSFVVE
ncbi:hypothetical protein HYZ41_00210, partial [archaeon]|nr:hypothetical protein [archaeon]